MIWYDKDEQLTVVIERLFGAEAAAWYQWPLDIDGLRRRLTCTHDRHWRLLSCTTWRCSHRRTTHWQPRQAWCRSLLARGRHEATLGFMHHLPVLQELSFDVRDWSTVQRICTHATTPYSCMYSPHLKKTSRLLKKCGGDLLKDYLD